MDEALDGVPLDPKRTAEPRSGPAVLAVLKIATCRLAAANPTKSQQAEEARQHGRRLRNHVVLNNQVISRNPDSGRTWTEGHANTAVPTTSWARGEITEARDVERATKAAKRMLSPPVASAETPETLQRLDSESACRQ